MPALRSQTIERVFADAKEKRAMRYTPYRGPTAVTAWVKLKYAAMNLKKLAIHKASKPTAHVAGFAIQGALQNTPIKKTRQGTPKGYPNLVFSLQIKARKKPIKSKTSIRYLSDTVSWSLR